MAGSVNKVILVGNLGKDPEVRTFNNGGKVANLSVATSESWKDRNSGEQRERTEWNKVAIFNEALVDVAEKYLRKGSKVYLEGKLQTRKYTDQQGQDRYVTEVVLQGFDSRLVLLDGRQQRSADDQYPEDYRGRALGGGSAGATKQPAMAGDTFDDDSDLPF